MYDIAVIGGGPVGSYSASRLAELGYSVVVLERRGSVGRKLCCTGIISQECVTRYSLPDSLILHKANSAAVFSPSGQTIKLKRPETQACIVDRPALDRFLADTAKSKGVEFRLNCCADNVIVESDRAVIKADLEGGIRNIEARTVLVAAGFAPALVKKIGLGLPGDFVAGVQAEVATSIEEVEVYFGRKLAPGFFAWIVPYSTGKGLIGLLTRRSPGFFLKKFIAGMESLGTTGPALSNLHFGGVPIKPLKKTFGERLLIVGDAAGQVKPTTGGGIYFGLLCADLAVAALHRGLQSGDLSAKNLSGYQSEWQELLGHELKIERYARYFFERLSDKTIDSIFNTLNSQGIVESLQKEESLSFDWHGGLMLKVLKLGLASRAARLIGLPFSRVRK